MRVGQYVLSGVQILLCARLLCGRSGWISLKGFRTNETPSDIQPNVRLYAGAETFTQELRNSNLSNNDNCYHLFCE